MNVNPRYLVPAGNIDYGTTPFAHRMKVPCKLLTRIVPAILLLLGAGIAPAIEELEAEVDIADLLPAEFPGDRPRDTSTRGWAVLPQIGYGPDTGALGGLKYAHRDWLQSGSAIDIDAVYSVNQHRKLAFSVASPHFLEDRALLLFRAKYTFDPQRDFFGLGNNDLLDCSESEDPSCACDPAEPGFPNCPQGDAFSTHEYQELGGALTAGWRPFERVAFNVAIGLRRVDIRSGKRKDRLAFTPDRFPDLSGIEGGLVQPLSLSLVWNTRDSVTRPTRGWRLILKIIHANQAFSDFKFTRYIADGGYLRAFDKDRYIFGLRINGEWVDARRKQVPFWELTELGGEDTLRGFFPHRFVGKGRILLNGEFRFRIYEFDFFDLWRVRVDGVTFGDGGRVFISRDDLRDEFELDTEILSRILDDLQYSYGAGLRFALSQAIVARVDAGFSEEETGLVYLSFGHTF